MRILKILFTACVVLALLGFIGFFIGREVALSAAVSQLRSQARFLKTMQVEPSFSQSCLEYGGSPLSNAPLVRSQLRFLSPSQYVVEVICVSAPTLRQTVREGSLPPFVQKAAGQSGLVDGSEDQGLQVTVFGRTGVVYQQEGVVQGTTQSMSEEVPFAGGPATVCSGYGYTCCGEVSQVGQGEHQSAALDCPRSCFASCAQKPIILSFQSEEPVLSEGRILSVRSGQTARLFYTISDVGITDSIPTAELGASGTVQVIFQMLAGVFTRSQQLSDQFRSAMVVFGDGSSTEVSDLQGVVEHTYTCSRPLCVYNATVQAVTQEGITSSLTDGSRIQVQVSP